MSSSTFLPRLERSRYFIDRNGNPATTKREDETLELKINWSNLLVSGESVSSVAYDANGVTISGESLATPVSIATVGGLGWVEVTATLSTGRILQRIFSYHEPGGSTLSDYRGC